MRSLSSRASRIYTEEGVVSLFDKGIRLVADTAIDRVARFPPLDPLVYRLSKWHVSRRLRNERDFEDCLNTVLKRKPGFGRYEVRAKQIPEELEELVGIVRDIEPKVVLEIGTAKGGTFYTWCRTLSTATTIISLDLPQGEFGGGYSERHISLFESFSNDKNLFFVRENSHNESTYEAIQEILETQTDGDVVDFLFIDGDHTYEGVKRDFEMYKPLVRDGGVIALHDIVYHPDTMEELQRRREAASNLDEQYLSTTARPASQVDQFWDEIVDEYQTEELIAHPEQTWGGIGVIYL